MPRQWGVLLLDEVSRGLVSASNVRSTSWGAGGVQSAMVSMGTVMFDACHVSRSMLAREVLKSASFEISMSFPCSASISRRLVIA